MCNEYTHIHFIFFQLSWTCITTNPFVILIPLFFCLFLSSFGYRLAARHISFHPELLHKSPFEPSCVDFQFYYNFKKIYPDILLELPKDDQVLLLQGFNDVL